LTIFYSADERSKDPTPSKADLGQDDVILKQFKVAGMLSAESLAESKPIHITFTERAANWPDRIALYMGDTQITFATLDAISSRVAANLKRYGVRSEDRVMVRMKRSPQLIYLLLGILKSGAAYIPVDADCPQARFAFLVEDSSPQVYVGDPDRITKSLRCRALSLETCLSRDFEEEIETAVSLEMTNLAYLIYTSGSTGEPKAVMVTHGGLANYVEWAISAYDLGHGGTSPFHTSVAFDLSITSIFPPLLAGNTIEIISGDGMDAVRALAGTGGHSAVKLTPGHLELLAELMDESIVASFAETLVVGGEMFPETLVAFWRQKAPDTVLVNEYGPTETVVGCSWCVIGPEKHWSAGVPLGGAIAGMDLFVLNSEMDPISVGEEGELYIGGAGLARGYWGQPGLTAERFVPDPLSPIDGARLYRSGDRARRLDDTSLHYIARVDDQLKLRGYRVEPGEIAAVLQRHPEILWAFVRAYRVGNEAKALVAYFKGKTSIATPQLRQYLEEFLPPYMVPAAFVQIEKIPLTMNGKLDTKALPPPTTISHSSSERVPEGSVEISLAQLWSELLGTKELTAEDNFFKLGGDSIIAIRLAAKARQLNLQITPRMIFDNPTIRGLARVVTSTRPTLPSGEWSGARSLTPAQCRFFESRDDIHGAVQRISIDAPENATAVDAQALVQILIERHESLRSRFERGDRWRCVIEPVSHLDNWFFVAPDAEDESYLREFDFRIDPHRTPILKALWVPGKAGRLLLAIHHLGVDGISWRILVEELNLLWHDRAARTLGTLSPPTAPPGVWAEALRRHTAAHSTQDEAWHWLSQNHDITKFSRDGDPQREHDIPDSVGFSLSEAQSRALAQSSEGSLHEFLLATLAWALESLTSAQTIQVEMEGHGREELVDVPDVSRTVGWFTSLVPLSIPIIRDEFRLQVAAVRGVLGKLPHKGVHFGAFLYLPATPALAAAFKQLPRASVGFNFLGIFDEPGTGKPAWNPSPDQDICRSAPELDRWRDFEILAGVQSGRLRVDWQYHRCHYTRHTVEKQVTRMQELLVTIVAGGNTVSSDTGPLTTMVSKKEMEQLKEVLGPSSLEEAEEVFPATSLQVGILFESLRSPDAGLYLEQSEYEIEGIADAGAIMRTWQCLIRDHQALRSGFVWDGIARPMTVIFKEARIESGEFDLSRLPESEQVRSISQYLDRDRNRPFDLIGPPLMRIASFRLSADRWKFIWTHHHILLDGWSNALLRREFLERYSRNTIDASALSSPRLADFVSWIELSDRPESEQFWKDYLSGLESSTSIPFQIQNAVCSHQYEETSSFLSEELTSNILSFARHHRLTLNTIVAAAWGILLGRCTGGSDVVFGSVMSLRAAPVEGIERMVGLIMNTVPVRMKVSGSFTTSTWLRSIQQELSRVQEHAHLSLPQIQGLAPISVSKPLFESLFTWENNQAVVDRGVAPQVGETSIREMSVKSRSHYPLVFIAGLEHRLNLRVVYDVARIKRQHGVSLIERLTNLLSRMIADGPLEQVHACTVEELDQIRSWGDGDRDISGHRFGARAATQLSDPRSTDSTLDNERLPGLRTYVLDGSLNFVPIEVPGEVWVGVDDLTSGCGQPAAATAEQFMPDPYSLVPGARMYRTGDLAAWQTSGRFVPLGLAKCKVPSCNSEEIDLGRVEEALSSLPETAASAALVIGEDAGTGYKLVAFVVPTHPMSAPIATTIKRKLRSILPASMIPFLIVISPNLPIVREKIRDQAGLETLAKESLREYAKLRSPQTAAERLMCRIWIDVLGVRDVGMEDDFFDLGGHSLTAFQLTSTTSEIFRMNFPLQLIFDHSTVRSFLCATAKERGGQDIVERIAAIVEGNSH
jgi:amino acid adenylation domain-containing protein/non-ribosomal peptide synthase protein (TIGR01720 family)